MQNSGKSSLAEKLSRDYQNSVLISRVPSESPGVILQYIASRIVFSSFMQNEESGKALEALQMFKKERDLNIETFTAAFAEICKVKNFILIIDDFNLLDDVVKEVLYHIFPALQVTGCKIVLFEDQAVSSSVEAVPNKTEHQLSPLLPGDIPLFLKENYAGYFPQKQLASLLEKFADLFPGNILLFLNELVANKILIFSHEGISVDEKISGKLSSVSQGALFKKRIAHLSKKEKAVLALLSAVDVELNLEQTKTILKNFTDDTEAILSCLQKKNLLRMPTPNSFNHLIYSGLKFFIYSGIADKVGHHKKIASIVHAIPGFFPNEVSRHYELGEEFDEAYLCLKTEINRASELSAFLYLTKIFSRLIKLPLSEKYAIEVRKVFLQILQKTGDSGLALHILEELELDFHVKSDHKLMTLKGVFLIASGAVEAGKKILIRQVEMITNKHNRIEILLEIANANLNTNLYDETKIVLDQLLKYEGLTCEQKGKVFNINGLLELYKNNNAEKAFSFFSLALNEFTKSDLKQRIARVQVNLGNICSMKGDNARAEQYWNSSLSINNSIGDLEQEALLLMNYGIYLFDTANYEKANELYKNAKNIFQTIGKKNGLGLTLLNSGETHLIICEYSTAIEEFLRAANIFHSTENKEEEASAYFFLAKTFIVIGNIVEAKHYADRYEKLITEGKLGEKHLLQLTFINALYNYYLNFSRKETDGVELRSLCNALLETDNRYDSVLASMIYVDHCIDEEKYKDGFSFLMNKKYAGLSTGNKIYDAVRSHLLGKLEIHHRFGEKPFIDYFNDAYESLKEESITEFTRIVLSMLGKIYFERNLFSKAEEFFNLTEGLIVFFSKNISDDSLRESYLSKKERREDLQFIMNSLPLKL